MKCNKCNKELDKKYKFCPNCGNSLSNDNPIWLLILGFLFPWPALIVYLVLRICKVQVGNYLLLSALIKIGAKILVYIIVTAFSFFAGAYDKIEINENTDVYSCSTYCDNKEYEIKDDECVCEDGTRFDFKYN